MPEPKTDCFAYRKTPFRTMCAALTCVECLHGECNFYCPEEKRNAQLLTLHGTTDLQEIMNKYAELRKERGYDD